MTTKTFPIHDGESRKAFVHAMLSDYSVTADRFVDTNFTHVVLKFSDGWSTTAHSVCVSDADYNFDMGKDIAEENALIEAKAHYWRTVGYMAMIGMTEVTVPWTV